MLASIVLITFAAAPLGLLARAGRRPLVGWVLAILPAAIFALLLAQFPAVAAEAHLAQIIPWVPGLGLDLHFRLDGLSLLFGLVISGIGTLIIGYAGHYMENDPGLGRFLVYLILFMGAMLGLVLAGNVLTLFVFWELTSLSSYLLIGYKHDYSDVRRGALQALIVTAGGGMALLVGLLILGEAARRAGVPAEAAYSLEAIIGAGAAIKQGPLYTPAMILIFLGCFTKSAQFPFHFWLPSAMQAPTPASAYLHSATMVKAGVYLLARLAPGLGGTGLWSGSLVIVGGFTFAFGAVVATRRSDIKALLAYTTLSMLGGLVMLIGLGGEYGARGLAVNILAHALYKAPLFMIAGIIDHETGTRDLRRLGGLRKFMPATMVFVALALLSQMSIPIFFGYVGKEVMIEAALKSPLADPWRYAALTAIVVGAAGYIVAGWRLFKHAFLGQPSHHVLQQHVTDPHPGMLAAPALPAALCLLLSLGLLPLVSRLLTPAAVAVYGAELELELALWHGLTPALGISTAVIAIGALLAGFERKIAGLPSALPGWLDGARLFDRSLDAIEAGAGALIGALETGKLRSYVLITTLTFLAMVGLPFVFFAAGSLELPADPRLQPYEIFAAGLIPVAIVAAINARSRLGAIIAVSVVGAMVSLFFILFSAPDLALTQLLIEVLSTVFLMLVFSVLPARFASLSRRWERARDATIAVVAGALMTGLALAAASNTSFERIAPWFVQNSLEEGQGHNVVNVILVDFRGFDTMGEVTVLLTALLGIYGLLRMRQGVPAPSAADLKASEEVEVVKEESVT